MLASCIALSGHCAYLDSTAPYNSSLGCGGCGGGGAELVVVGCAVMDLAVGLIMTVDVLDNTVDI